MTNKEKFKEIFEKTFGFVPEDRFPCPEKCPERFTNAPCSDDCPYSYYWKKEYKKPEVSKNVSDFSFEMAGMMDDLASTLRKHSPIKERELFYLIAVFMDVVTDDHIPVDDDLAGVRLDLAEMFYKTWPHSVEYYKKGEKKE